MISGIYLYFMLKSLRNSIIGDANWMQIVMIQRVIFRQIFDDTCRNFEMVALSHGFCSVKWVKNSG